MQKRVRLEYRNAIYEGGIEHGQRNGRGLLLDDDLSFSFSNFRANAMQGATVIYSSHGKYFYGTFENDVPHGLCVFRSGDLVLVARFVGGAIRGKLFVILEHLNSAAMLECRNQNYTLIDYSDIGSHEALVSRLQELELPSHYYSLTRFLAHLSAADVQTYTIPAPNHTQNYCYFGFKNGLAIIFDYNHSVVSVGVHSKEQVILGYQQTKTGSVTVHSEGNFETNDVLSYQGHRPTAQIHSIYQKTHKLSLGFVNEYAPSIVGVFYSLESTLKNKILAAIEKVEIRGDINDSLDFKDYPISNEVVKRRAYLYQHPQIHPQLYQNPSSKQSLSQTHSQLCPNPPSKQSLSRLNPQNIQQNQPTQPTRSQAKTLKSLEINQISQKQFRRIHLFQKPIHADNKPYKLQQKDKVYERKVSYLTQSSEESQSSLLHQRPKSPFKQQNLYQKQSHIVKQPADDLENQENIIPKLQSKIDKKKIQPSQKQMSQKIGQKNPLTTQDDLKVQRTIKEISSIKTNSIYKKSAANILKDQPLQNKDVYVNNTFNADPYLYKQKSTAFQKLNEKDQVQCKLNYDYTFYKRNSNNLNTIEESRSNLNTKNDQNNVKLQNARTDYKKTPKIIDLNQNTFERVKNNNCTQRKNIKQHSASSIKATQRKNSSPFKELPTYQNIQERRKRILESFKDLNNKKYESPILSMMSHETEHSSFGYSPLSLQKQERAIVQSTPKRQKQALEPFQFKEKNLSKQKEQEKTNKHNVANKKMQADHLFEFQFKPMKIKGGDGDECRTDCDQFNDCSSKKKREFKYIVS